MSSGRTQSSSIETLIGFIDFSIVAFLTEDEGRSNKDLSTLENLSQDLRLYRTGELKKLVFWQG